MREKAEVDGIYLSVSLWEWCTLSQWTKVQLCRRCLKVRRAADEVYDFIFSQDSMSQLKLAVTSRACGPGPQSKQRAFDMMEQEIKLLRTASNNNTPDDLFGPAAGS